METLTNIGEYENALEVLFNKIEDACQAVGLDLKIEFEDGESGWWFVGIWVEGGMVEIYNGEISQAAVSYRALPKWAQIERATSIAELPEGLADGDARIREKAEAKRKELADKEERDDAKTNQRTAP